MLYPRIYWLGTHRTLRYEEVPLLIEAGAEVIPGLGDSFWLRYDTNYENETDKLYPHWRKSCTLPTHIVETIRRIDILNKKGKVTPDEADLINAWIDVIFVHHYIDLMENISNWFQGYVVYRVFGHGGFTTYTKEARTLNVNLDKLATKEKYVWCPILNGLDEPEDDRLIKNKFYLNAFVSNDRLGFKWKGMDSAPIISTTISYVDGHQAARDIFMNFTEYFSDIPFVVLGKNSKSAIKGLNKVTGYLDDDLYFSQIANSRLFVYIGFGSKYHVHYTPIEAMCMGVPVVFLDNSGLAQEARDHEVSNDALKECGMCSSIEEIYVLVSKLMNDFEALEELSNSQYNLFGKIFNRESALQKTREFYAQIQRYINEHRQLQYIEPAAFNILKEKNYFRHNSLKSDLPSEIGQRVIFSLEKMNSFTGNLKYDDQGRFVARKAEKYSDTPGLLIADYVGAMKPGVYKFSVFLNSDEEVQSPVGLFSIGAWYLQYTELVSQEMSTLQPGENAISLIVEISNEIAFSIKELRLLWNGNVTCEISNIVVDKLS